MRADGAVDRDSRSAAPFRECSTPEALLEFGFASTSTLEAKPATILDTITNDGGRARIQRMLRNLHTAVGAPARAPTGGPPTAFTTATTATGGRRDCGEAADADRAAPLVPAPAPRASVSDAVVATPHRSGDPAIARLRQRGAAGAHNGQCGGVRGRRVRRRGPRCRAAVYCARHRAVTAVYTPVDAVQLCVRKLQEGLLQYAESFVRCVHPSSETDGCAVRGTVTHPILPLDAHNIDTVSAAVYHAFLGSCENETARWTGHGGSLWLRSLAPGAVPSHAWVARTVVVSWCVSPNNGHTRARGSAARSRRGRESLPRPTSDPASG